MSNNTYKETTMTKCTRPVEMKDGKYVLCGGEAKYTIGMWDVCEECKPVADYYRKKYGKEDNYEEDLS